MHRGGTIIPITLLTVYKYWCCVHSWHEERDRSLSHRVIVHSGNKSQLFVVRFTQLLYRMFKYVSTQTNSAVSASLLPKWNFCIGLHISLLCDSGDYLLPAFSTENTWLGSSLTVTVWPWTSHFPFRTVSSSAKWKDWFRWSPTSLPVQIIPSLLMKWLKDI